ncbi:MAG: hypothetical protein EOM54_10090 [Clostridia bacterium]|nr:hypothetical protein [Clostridia bacterium]
MADNFKRLAGVGKSRVQQGRIYFTCRNYADEIPAVKKKIERLCAEAGGAYSCALFDFMTSGKSTLQITMDYYISEATLSRARRRFYELW